MLLLAAACAAPSPETTPSPSTKPAPSAPAPPERSEREAPAADERCLSIARIEIWKAEHTLRAYCTDGDVITMPVALGHRPQGAKTRSGDRRTPEGRYAISADARPSRFHLFVPIDYPSRADAALALAHGRVDESTYQRIVDAHDLGQAPPQDTPLGGHIGLHGEGEDHVGDSARGDWTWGCIAVTDEQITLIAERIEVGAPVWIHP